jgi:hypothetical protein
MVNGFYKTPEGVKEYEKIHAPYENSADDEAYQAFLKMTKECPEKQRRREILSLTRKVIGNGSKEFILWNERLSALDGLGNERHHFRGSMGTYPIPIPVYELRQVPDTLVPEKVRTGIKEVKTGYSTPFTTKAADLFYKDCITDGDKPTTFCIEAHNTRISVDSFKDWRDGEMKELQRFGHIANSYEKQRLADEEAGKIPAPTPRV